MLEDIIIAGAGPTGLTLACELFRHGVPCRIIDRESVRPHGSRATDIHSRTVEVFSDLGIADTIIARGKKVRTFKAYADGALIAELDFDTIETPFPFSVAIPQHDTETILEARLVELGGRVERGVSLSDVSQYDDGVWLSLHHANGRVERLHSRWLVGCDGVYSQVRRALRLPFLGRSYRQKYIVADVDIDWNLDHDAVHLFMAQDGFFNVLALPGGPQRGRILCDVPADDISPPTLSRFQNLLHRRAGVPGTLSRPSFLSSFRVARRIVPQYRIGAVFLAGDAAHTCSPLLGQGMNTGIQDACNLGWKLALVYRGQAHTTLLDSYHAERAPVAKTVLAQTHLAHTMATLRRPVVRKLRDGCTRLVSRSPLARHEAAVVCSELGLHYRQSPVVSPRWPRLAPRSSAFVERLLRPPARSTVPVAGERAPDVELATAPPTQLFDLLAGSHHTLLWFFGQTHSKSLQRSFMRVAHSVRQSYRDFVKVYRVGVSLPDLGGGTRLLDPDGALHRRYGASPGTVCIVRPDRYIAYRVDSASAAHVLAYLDRILTGQPATQAREALPTDLAECIATPS